MSLPLVNRLCIREGFCIAVLNPPLGYSQVLGQLPDNVTVANSLEVKFDLIQFFVIKRRKLKRELPQLKAALRDDGLLWVSYPKGNRLNSDISRDSITAYAVNALLSPGEGAVNKFVQHSQFGLDILSVVPRGRTDKTDKSF